MGERAGYRPYAWAKQSIADFAIGCFFSFGAKVPFHSKKGQAIGK